MLPPTLSHFSWELDPSAGAISLSLSLCEAQICVFEAGQETQNPRKIRCHLLYFHVSPGAYANLLYTDALSNLILLQINIFVLLALPGYETCPDMVEFQPWEQLRQTEDPQ